MTARPILIVDDEAPLRDFLCSVLEAEGYVVLEAGTGREAVRLCAQHDPQLVILDILMPKMDGFQALDHIRQAGDTPVMMLTRKHGDDDKVHAFELGADDYLSKPFSSRELTARVKAVLRRTRGSVPADEPTQLIAGDLTIDRAARRVIVDQRTVALSRTEFQIVTELARTPGRILSREQLLTAVWGAEYRDDGRVLRCAIYHLRQKIERDASQPRHILGLRDVGYWIAVSGEADA